MMKLNLRKDRLRVLIVLTFALATFTSITQSFNAEHPALKLTTHGGLPADTWDYFLPRTNPTFLCEISTRPSVD